MFRRLLLKVRLAKGKCTECACPIPDWNLSDSIVGHRLVCQRCRNEGSYEGRCPICNDGRVRTIEDREYSFEEVQAMHQACFLDLVNDYKYQMVYSPDYLIEKRSLKCASCGHYLLRDNAGCPRCKEMAPTYEERLSQIQISSSDRS